MLVERDNYEKRRPGEHLAGRIRGALDALRVSTDDARAISAASPGILSLWNGRAPLTKPYAASGQPDALCVTRQRFDEMLFHSAQGAGATVVRRVTQDQITRAAGGGWDITIEAPDRSIRSIHARSVVDATGRNASFARRQGARRIHHGDLLAIVGWLETGEHPVRPGAMLTIESCQVGWWSLSVGADGTFVATLYTSSQMMRAAGATPEIWWGHALGKSRTIARALSRADATLVETQAYRVFPSRLSKLFGDGWIAIGDAAVAFDPIAGQGVAMAIDTAFRAFEAATVDPSWSVLGPAYRDALIDRFDRHLAGRARVYEEAAGVLSEPFVRHAVLPH
jgi:flavin-dependent dehydrogenase